MEIGQVFKEEYITLDLKAQDKKSAMTELIAMATKEGMIKSGEAVYSAVMEREKAFTTKIMEKIAIPHAKSEAIYSPMILLGRSRKGVVWEDGVDFESCPVAERVYLTFMILVPGGNADNEHMKILATLARCLSHESFRNDLLNATGEQEVLQIVEQMAKKVSGNH